MIKVFGEKESEDLSRILMLVSILLILSLTLGEDIVGGVDVKKPRILDFAGTARWLAHENFWGTIGTISVRLDGAPFTQPKSFVDGPADNSTGVLYFYDSIMDESLVIQLRPSNLTRTRPEPEPELSLTLILTLTAQVDIIENNVVSFSLSATQLGHCPPTKISDPEVN